MFLYPGHCAKPLTCILSRSCNGWRCLGVLPERMPVKLFEQCLSLSMTPSQKNEYLSLRSLGHQRASSLTPRPINPITTFTFPEAQLGIFSNQAVLGPYHLKLNSWLVLKAGWAFKGGSPGSTLPLTAPAALPADCTNS